MNNPVLNIDNFFKKACIFEASLILVAILLGWISEINPFEKLHFSEIAIAYGFIGTVPLLILFFVLEHVKIESVIKIRQLLLDTLGPGLYRYHWTDLLILAAIAGVSEEVIFRGVIQPWMESNWGATAALIGSNIIFGLAHALTPLYAVLAGLIGIYLGLSMDFVEQRNLLIPIVIHGLYDYLAFMLLMRTYRIKQKNNADSKE